MEAGDYVVIAVALLAALVTYLDRPKPKRPEPLVDRAYLRRTDPVWRDRGSLR
jgi:hypothetical protein